LLAAAHSWSDNRFLRGRRVKHFINKQLLAPNVFTMPVDTGIVAAFADLAATAEADPAYCTLRPEWNSDIRWISAATRPGFAKFEDAFKRLEIGASVREFVDVEREVRLYAGFLHTRSECAAAHFHTDWTRTNNEAFTLLTPVRGYEGQKLWYKNMVGEVAEYRYRYGEAIVFGDHFIHSTPPGSCDPPFTFLVFNFGSDKMEHWAKIRRTTGTQCRLIRRPDGTFEESTIAEQSGSAEK
jgi:hypothetical protein